MWWPKTINNTQLHPWMERVLLFKSVFLPTYYFQYHPHHRYTCICHLDTGRICKCPKSSWQNGKVFEQCRNSLSTSGSFMIIYNYIHISIVKHHVIIHINSIYKHHIYISYIHKNRQLVDPSRWPIASSEGVRATVANGGDVVFASGWRSGRRWGSDGVYNARPYIYITNILTYIYITYIYITYIYITYIYITYIYITYIYI